MDFTGENLLRELTPQVLGAVVQRFGDFSAAEDAVQEALLAAAMQWPEKGVPDNPRGWLIQVAARRMTDHLRVELARRRREVVVAMQMPPDQMAPAVDSEEDTGQDDTLILLFMCSHPALMRSSAIALTLRAIGGLTTAEIATPTWCPRPPWRSGLAGPSSASKHPACDSACPPTGSGQNGWARCCTCST
jgi:predicted RNA polymerase sigma factor